MNLELKMTSHPHKFAHIVLYSSFAALFRVSRYLCTEEDVPVADYLLFESMLYPKHYIRRYDNATTVDCEVC